MYGAALFPIRLLDSSFSMTIVNTWLKVGSAGVGVGVGAGVGVGVGAGVGVGDAVGVGAGVAVGRGVAVGVGVATGFGVGVAARVGVGVACAALVGRGVGVPAFAAPEGDAELDGPSATDGGVIDPPALGGASSSDVVHKSKAATPAPRTSRRKTRMGGIPPTLH